MMKYFKYTLILALVFLSSCAVHVPYATVYEVMPAPRFAYRSEPVCKMVTIHTYYGHRQARKCKNVIVKRLVTNHR